MNQKKKKLSTHGSIRHCLCRNFSTTRIMIIIMDLRKHINGNFDTSQLLIRLDKVQKPFSADHWHFSSPAAMFGVAILIAVVSFVIWKKCCAQAPSTAHTPRLHRNHCLRFSLSHSLKYRCRLLRICLIWLHQHIHNKIRCSISQNRRPLCSFIPNQREGITSFFTVLFRTHDFTCTFIFAF
jgi:hypothetical protein